MKKQLPESIRSKDKTKMIKEIESRLDYLHVGRKGEYEVFVSEDKINERFNYHYFIEVPCAICGKPYARRRWGKTKAHRLCSNRKIAENKRVSREKI